MQTEFILKTDKETKEIGQKIGECISSKFSIHLCGDLGSGKTTITQGLAKGLAISDEYYITSPTYNIINEYPPGHLKLYHIDLYRIEEFFELDDIGIDEIMEDEEAVVVIEWPEILKGSSLYSYDLKINFSVYDNSVRKISLSVSGREGSNLLKKLLL